jgi:hypothetical protein
MWITSISALKGERRLPNLVCNKKVGLQTAQREIATDAGFARIPERLKFWSTRMNCACPLSILW